MRLVISKKRLELLMERAGIETYQELAAAADVHPNSLTRIIGKGGWKSETVEKLAKALSCNPIDMMETDGFPDPNWAALAVPSM